MLDCAAGPGQMPCWSVALHQGCCSLWGKADILHQWHFRRGFHKGKHLLQATEAQNILWSKIFPL